jgi:hypothetical protein
VRHRLANSQDTLTCSQHGAQGPVCCLPPYASHQRERERGRGLRGGGKVPPSLQAPPQNGATLRQAQGERICTVHVEPAFRSW